MVKPKIGVVGNGFVGKALVRGFMLDADIKIHDKFQSDTDSLEKTVAHSNYIFLCLPTPMKSVEGGEIDLSTMNSVVEEISSEIAGSDKILIIKSTVIPGTTQSYIDKYKSVRFCFCPEFLTARQAHLDFINAARHIFGGHPDITKELDTQLFRPRFPGGHFFHTDPTSAELVKYMSNLFFAVKIAFCNEFYDIINAFGCDYSKIQAMVLADGRIGNSHMTVPSQSDGLRGFGGTCFPKDMNAMIHLCKKMGIPTDILEAAWKNNLRVREDYDWGRSKSAVSKPQES